MAVIETGHVVVYGLPAIYEETDLKFAQDSMESNLKLIEILLKNDPGNRELLLAAAQGFCGHATLFLEDSEPDRARTFYMRGRGYGLRLLDAQGLSADLSKAGKDDVPALFWTAQCTAGWMNVAKDDPDAVAELPKVFQWAKRARDLDAGYWYGAPEALLGAYYAARPKMFGGDTAKSREHFEAATAKYPDFLLNRVLYAQYYAVAAQDKALFKSELESIANDEPKLPEQAMANGVARLKAKHLLEKIDELF